jgi:hypothetical protein
MVCRDDYLLPISTGINAGHTGRHVDHMAIHAAHKALASSLEADDARGVAHWHTFGGGEGAFTATVAPAVAKSEAIRRPIP